MATNPRIPEERPPHPRLERHLQPPARVPWFFVAIILAAGMLLAMIIWLPRAPRATSPRGAQIPAQPTGAQIQLTQLKLMPAPTGGAAYLDAQLVNAGGTAINGVQVDVGFKGKDGANVGTIRRPVEGIAGGGNATTQDLTDAPIKPGESRHVRISLDQVPQGWDQQMPSLTVSAVTGVGNKGQGQNATPSETKPQGSASEPAGSNPKSGGKTP